MIGSGYVGLTTGTCLAELGNEVLCVDIDEKKIENLKNCILPIYEPGLKEFVEKNMREERLKFTTELKSAILFAEVIFIAVGTPQGRNEEADLTAVREVASLIGKYIKSYKVVVIKSTVPVGTANTIKEVIKKNLSGTCEFDVVSNPEFLREGEAIYDFMNPDRIVIGTDNGKARKIMEQIYSAVARTDKPILFTDIKSSELIKYASNAMLATRISFMNELALLCDKVGGDVKLISKGMGLDKRICPRFLQAGAGWGGSCFPKDVRALIKTMAEHGVESKILKAVVEVNENQKSIIVTKIKRLVPNLKGKSIAVWGLSFKPKTDDMREAPSITIIQSLLKEGARVMAFDPIGEANARKFLPDIKYCKNPYDAITDCDCLVIVTEWNEFRELDKQRIKNLLREPNIVDARNIYEPEEMKKLGFNYIGVGR